MMEFTAYSTATGEILRCGRCQDVSFEAQAGPGEAVIEGRYPDDQFYIVTGQPVNIPPRPSMVAAFDHASGQWIDPRTLDQVKASARARVVAWAAAERTKYITVLPGQEMIYLAKEAEAVRFVADPAPDMAAYPFLASEIGVTATTPYELAQVWLFMSQAWRGAAAQIEQARLAALAQIEAALTIAEVEAVVVAPVTTP